MNTLIWMEVALTVGPAPNPFACFPARGAVIN